VIFFQTITDTFAQGSTDWHFRHDNEAILFEGRAVETFDNSVRLLFKSREFRGLLESVGTERTAAIKAVKSIYGV